MSNSQQQGSNFVPKSDSGTGAQNRNPGTLKPCCWVAKPGSSQCPFCLWISSSTRFTKKIIGSHKFTCWTLLDIVGPIFLFLKLAPHGAQNKEPQRRINFVCTEACIRRWSLILGRDGQNIVCTWCQFYQQKVTTCYDGDKNQPLRFRSISQQTMAPRSGCLIILIACERSHSNQHVCHLFCHNEDFE